MVKTIKVDAPKSGLTIQAEVPDGWQAWTSRVPQLGYPWEVLTVADWSCPKTPFDPNDPSPMVWPRVDIMPAKASLVWIIRGSVGFDATRSPQDAQWFSAREHVYLAAEGIDDSELPAQSQVSWSRRPEPFRSSDEYTCRWNHDPAWRRCLPLIGRDGSVPEAPEYLSVYGFCGGASDPSSGAMEVLASIQVSYS